MNRIEVGDRVRFNDIRLDLEGQFGWVLSFGRSENETLVKVSIEHDDGNFGRVIIVGSECIIFDRKGFKFGDIVAYKLNSRIVSGEIVEINQTFNRSVRIITLVDGKSIVDFPWRFTLIQSGANSTNDQTDNLRIVDYVAIPFDVVSKQPGFSIETFMRLMSVLLMKPKDLFDKLD